MKEGYYQSKVADFSEKIQGFEHRLEMAETEYERFQKQLGEFKQLLKKLKNIEEFQENAIKKVSQENEDAIEKKLNFITDNAEKKMESLIDKKSVVLTKALLQIQEDEKQLIDSLDKIESFENDLVFFKQFQKLLMLKLMNKGILNNRELQEIELRAKKRTRLKK